jgi:hypothetical protein
MLLEVTTAFGIPIGTLSLGHDLSADIVTH